MDEMRELLQRARNGEISCRDQIVLTNTGLVWSVVRRFNGRGYEAEDLFQIGCIGLLKAVDRFDLSFDVCFSTYAVPMIAGEIRRFLRDDGMLKVSRSVKELAMRVRTAREDLTAKLGHEPGIDELASQVGASREEVAASLEAVAQVDSIYRNIGNKEGQEFTLIDRLTDENKEEEKLMNRLVLERLMERLEGVEREIIVRRYFEDKTQTQIAKELSLSQVQVSRMEKRILQRMREFLA